MLYNFEADNHEFRVYIDIDHNVHSGEGCGGAKFI